MTSLMSGESGDGMSAAPLVQGIAGLMCGFLAIVQSAGFGLLLLSGNAPSLVSAAVGMALFSTAVMALVAAITSSTPGVIAIAQGIPIAAMAGPVAAIVDTISVDASGNDPTATVVAAVALTTVAIGAAAYLLGVFGWGRFIRFVRFL
jgi:sulfate permease, SulP family